MQAIRTREPNACVLIISDQDNVPYQRPPLSKELWFGPKTNDFTFKDWQGNESSVFYQGKDSYNIFDITKLDQMLKNDSHKKVHFLKNCSVDSIDTCNKIITIGSKQIQYSKVLIATGGTPKQLNVSIDDKTTPFVSTFRSLEDFTKLEYLASNSTGKKFAVIGGGFLGSELAAALAQKKNVEVVQIFPEKGNFPSKNYREYGVSLSYVSSKVDYR